MTKPLVAILKRVREAHKISQQAVANCLSLAKDQYRHIEKGRRPLPKLEDGLVSWVRQFEECVGATPAERQEIYDTLSRYIVELVSKLLDDPPVDPGQ